MTASCAGCEIVLHGRRVDARWCGEACRKRTRRRIRDVGFDAADWERRSERFWAEMAELHARPGAWTLRAGKAGQSPDRRRLAIRRDDASLVEVDGGEA